MNRITYSDIETVSDVLLKLNQEAQLKLNVRLGHNSSDNTRKPFINGYMMNSQRYPNNPTVVSIKRHFDYYLSIESWKNKDLYFQIRPMNMFPFMDALNKAYNWLNNGSIWINVDGNLRLVNCPESQDEIYVYHLFPGDIPITFKPMVVYDENDKGLRGIRLTVKDRLNFTDIDANSFGALCYIIKSLDLYTAACTIVNSLPQAYQEPSFVKSLVWYNNDTKPRVEDTSIFEGVQGGKRRTPPNKENKTTLDDL